MAENREGKGLKGFFKSLFSEEVAEEEQEEVVQKEKIEKKEEVKTVSFSPEHHSMTGSLLQLWRMWAGNRVPPSISLTEALHKSEQGSKLDLAKLEQEWARINLQMELHAKRHLQILEKAKNEARNKAKKEEE